MNKSANRFYNSISDVRGLSQVALIEMFVYHLTVELGPVDKLDFQIT